MRRARRIRQLARDLGNTFIPGLKVTVWVDRHDGGARRTLSEDPRVQPGDTLVVQIENDSRLDLDISIRFLDAACGVTPIEIDDAQVARFTKVQSKPFEVPLSGPLSDDALGRESLLVFATVREKGEGRRRAPLGAQAQPAALDGEGQMDIAAVQEAPILRSVSGMRPNVGTTRGPDGEEERPIAFREHAWTTTWGQLEGLDRWNERLRELPGPIGMPPRDVAAGAPPPRPTGSWYRSAFVPGGDDAADVLLLDGKTETGEQVRCLVFDADGDAALGSRPQPELIFDLMRGALPVELVVLAGAGGTTAAYPRHIGDGACGLVLEASPSGDRAGWRYERRDDAWHREASSEPWLSSAHLPPALDLEEEAREESRARLILALRRFWTLP